jgi:hypothetical protein
MYLLAAKQTKITTHNIFNCNTASDAVHERDHRDTLHLRFLAEESGGVQGRLLEHSGDYPTNIHFSQICKRFYNICNKNYL